MNLFSRFRKYNPLKISQESDVLGFALHGDGRVVAIKQGSGMYGAGFGADSFSETAFGTAVALSQSTFGWSAAYSVSTWVYRCVEVRKSAISRMPWQVVDMQTKQVTPSHPLSVAIKRNRQKFFKKVEQSQLLYGETFIEVGRNDYGFRSDLFWLNNNGMAVLIGSGQIVGYAYTAMQGGSPQNFEPDEVAFMRTDNPFNDLRGMSPTEVIMDEVAIDKDVARVVRSYYANDTRVGVLLIPKRDLQPAESERFMATWKAQNQGVNKAGKPVLMPYDISVERMQEPATLDDVQLRESTRREICAAYGVPLALAGAWDDANYDSVDTQRKSFYEETIIPECDSIQDFINADIMPHFDDSGRYEFRFNYTSILALTEDAKAKNDIYSNRLVSGLITRAEARAALGHPVREVDDVYYIPGGSTVVPANEESLVTPTANEVTNTPQQQDALPQPSAPRQIEPSNQPARLPPGKAIEPPQSDPADELAAWERKAVNNGAVKALTFVCHVLPHDVQDMVRDALRVAGKDANKVALKTIFATIKHTIEPAPWPDDAVKTAYKSYEDTSAAFIRTFKNAVNGAMNDVVSRKSFGSIIRAALKQYGTRAYLDGYGEDEIDSLGSMEVSNWLTATSEYVTSFADSLFSEGLTPQQIEQRAAIWAGNSLGEMHLAGLMRNKRNKRYMWVRNPNSDSCKSCIKLDGQVHRLSEWYSRDIRPKSLRLDCSLGCTCALEATEEPSAGRFLG